VERCEEPKQFLEEWMELYTVLIQKHNIRGIRAFSRQSFERQLEVPGIVAFRATYNGTTVSMLLWYVQGEVGYYHLGASNRLGYELHASFGLFWYAIEYFATYGLRWLDLGAGAGLRSNASDGLSRFKSGWSTGTRTVYFCGRIFDHCRYSELVKAKGMSSVNYFPAYRFGEF
jgi:hypothetical protein